MRNFPDIIAQLSPPSPSLTFVSEELDKMCCLSSSRHPAAENYSVIAMVIQISGLLKHVNCSLSPIAKQVANKHLQGNGRGTQQRCSTEYNLKGLEKHAFQMGSAQAPSMHYPQLTAHVPESTSHWHSPLISIHCGTPTTNNVSPTTDLHRFIQSDGAIDFPPSRAQ